MRDGLSLRRALEPHLIGHFQHQDAVLADETHQRHQAHLRIDVDAGTANSDTNEDQRAGERHRHRDQDHDRIAEAVEQGRQREEDDDDRKTEGRDEPTRFRDLLTRLSGIVDGIARRQGFRRKILQRLDRLAHRHARHGHAGNGRCINLLEVIARFRRRQGFHMGNG